MEKSSTFCNFYAVFEKKNIDNIIFILEIISNLCYTINCLNRILIRFKQKGEREMTHKMNLHNDPFEKIACGIKNIELRLYDEKRRLIKVGDEIVDRILKAHK